MSVYLGIDLGGTNIKTAVVDANCNILAEANLPTKPTMRAAEAVCDDIIATIHIALKKAGLGIADVAGAGLGSPGSIDDKEGIVRYSNNLYWKNFEIRKYIFDRTGLSLAVGNDANVAALGEVYAGCAKGANSAIIMTLGTGVGSGVVLNGKIWTGFNGAACEMGHMVVVADGYPCTCGRNGCIESYASATGLIRMTREAIEANPNSLLVKIVEKDGKVSGRTAFEAEKAGDKVGAEVVKEYIHYLAIGITNAINIFFPEVIGLSGGVANEGENLLARLREETYAGVFGSMKEQGKETKIVQCTLGYKAGLVGAAMLGKQWGESEKRICD